MANVAVIYYSATGNVHALAHAIEGGARHAGAETRIRHVAELAPEEAIAKNDAWSRHRERVHDEPVAELGDLEWADAIVFGTPTRFGNVSSQLKQFLDMTGPLWAEGKLADKVVSGFTSAMNPNGGQESTLLALYNTMYHWGAVVVTPGYTDQSIFEAGGNPYGTSSSSEPTDADLAAARYQGERVARIAEALAGARVDAGRGSAD
jgi:NAD(P)H dehydrogenase (quinone)